MSSCVPPIDIIMKETREQEDIKRGLTRQGLLLTAWDEQKPIPVIDLPIPLAPWSI